MSAKEQLDAFMRLEPGWDQYQGKALNRPSRDMAEWFIEAHSYLGEPKCVPCPNGGVQLEWHNNGVDIEIYVFAPENCENLQETVPSQGTTPLLGEN